MLLRSRRLFFFVSIVALVLIQSPCHAQTVLSNGGSWSGVIPSRGWQMFTVDVKDWESVLKIKRVSMQALGTPQIYVRFNTAPTLTQYDQKLEGTGDGTITVDIIGTPKIQTGKYYVGIYVPARMRARIDCSIASTTSSRTGMGAKPYDQGTATKGTSFRVWAPFAQSVNVAGEFNAWNGTATALQSENNGYWSLDYRNATVNQQYKYAIKNGSNTFWRCDPYEEQITNSVGNSVIFDSSFTWTDGAFVTPAWNEMIIYEMHVGTFNDAPGGRPGTFSSSTDRLDHVRDLGANAVELMPIHEFPGDYSWGYNPSYPFTVEEAYGGTRALKEFVNQSHSRGIAVIMDIVNNHWGPSDLGLWQFDGWSQNNKGGIYFYQDNRSSTPWGDTRPDFGRGEVRQYIRDQAIMFLQDFHVDGFRWDSTINIRSSNAGDIAEGWSLMQWVNNEVNNSQPWKIQIAEDLQNNASIVKPTGEGGAGFDSQWDASFVHPIRNAIIQGDDNNRNMDDVKNALQFAYSGDKFQRIIYTESHDEVANGKSRVPEEIWPGNAGSWFSRKRSTLGAALVMTSPGIPMIFQGQEFLEDGFFSDSDPLDWTKSTTYAGIELMYRDLMKLRRNWFNNTRGLHGHNLNVFHSNNTNKMLAFHRWQDGGGGDDVVIIANFKNTTYNGYRVGFPRAGNWQVRFNSDWVGYSSDFGNVGPSTLATEGVAWDGLNQSATFNIGPYSVLILSQ